MHAVDATVTRYRLIMIRRVASGDDVGCSPIARAYEVTKLLVKLRM